MKKNIFISLFLILGISVFATTYRLKLLSTSEGLSQQDVECIIQDKLGYIWIGSYDGLNRYDGNGLTHFRRIPTDTMSLIDNRIQRMVSWNSRDEIWIGTEGSGVAVYDMKRNLFSTPRVFKGSKGIIRSLHQVNDDIWIGGFGILTRISFDDRGGIREQKYELNGVWNENTSINTIINDSSGNILVGTSVGLFFKSHSSEDFVSAFGENEIYQLVLDNQGTIWAVSNTGLYFCSSYQRGMDNNMYKFTLVSKNIHGETISGITAISEDMYIVNTNTRLYWLKNSNGSFIFDRINFTDNSFFLNNTIRHTYLDNTMNLWINSTMEGVAYFDLNQKQINRQTILDKDFDSRSFVQAIVKDHRSRMWIGTNGGCVVRSSEDEKIKSPVLTEPVYGLYSDSHDNVWCSSLNAIYFFPEADESSPYNLFNDYRIPATLSFTDGPYSICEDTLHHNIWIGLRSGLLKIKMKNGKIHDYTHYSYLEFGVKRLSNITTLQVMSKRNSIIVTSANSGVFEAFLTNTGDLHKIVRIPNVENIQTVDHVWSIHEASNGCIYIGTDSGLKCLLLDSKNQYLIHPIESDDERLNTYKITSLQEDTQSNLWLSTGSGLISYNIKNENIALYFESDGLLSRTLTEGSLFDASTNRLYVGGIKGLSVVDLNSLNTNEIAPRTVVQNIRVNNQLIQPGEMFNNRIILPNALNYTSSIYLKYFENNISFDFASLHYSNADKNQYAYKLDGFDSEWVYLGTHHTATFTNLPSGRYTLHISSANGDGVWDPNFLSIDLVVATVPWLSVWAISLYVLIVGAIFFFINREVSIRRRIKHDHLMEQMEQQKKLEVAEIKLKYHTNITHELRTPLSLIVGPVQELIDKEYNDVFLNFRLKNIKNSADRLLQLVSQFLDLRKIMSDRYELRIKYQRIYESIMDIKRNFESLAKAKSIQFDLIYDIPMTYGWCDIEVINKICYNLISNALKYTPEGGRVSVFISTDPLQQLVICVEDTGIGIAPDELDNVFERFYQSPNAVGGSGIGLHLCKHLTLLHKGSIQVKSNLGGGSTFQVTLPVDKKAFEISDIVIDDTISVISTEIESEVITDDIVDGRDLILVVEDNIELRKYLVMSLSEDADVIEAGNGEEGYNLAVKRIPSIIVSDIMMPEVDGMEFVKRCKSNLLTSHIPFIFLTAKDSLESEIEGLSFGAEDYITKPFNMQTLRLKINNMKRLCSSHREGKQDKGSLLNERELNFINELKHHVLEHLSSPDFGVDELCHLMCISRMQMYRKMAAILSTKPSQFIKEIRMKKAYEIMKEKGYNITETMQEVGYTNHSYFSKLFVEVNGISPREVMNGASSQT